MVNFWYVPWKLQKGLHLSSAFIIAFIILNESNILLIASQKLDECAENRYFRYKAIKNLYDEFEFADWGEAED